LTTVPFSFQASLRPYQEESVEASRKKEMGVIVAPPGSGKTVIALKIIAEKQQPALIIVHRQDLARQWLERIDSFLGIPLKEIGKIGQGKVKPGKQVTVATIQSLTRLEVPELYSAFGVVIVDECHHIPADTFRNTVARFNSRYLYGLTATPFRKYNDGKLIFMYLGERIAEVRVEALSGTKHPTIVIRDTPFDVPFEPKTDRFETLSKILVHDSERNKLIVKDILEEIGKGRKAVVLTEQKEHIESLGQLLKHSCEIVTLSGEDAESSRQAKWKLLKEGNYQVLITTGQLFGEGTDLDNANCLFLVYPFSFEGKLVQYIGRVQRSEVSPTIYDYRDIRIGYLKRMFLKRNVYYRKLEKQRSLFDIPESDENRTSDAGSRESVVEKNIKIKIEDLEFLYGGFRFAYRIPEHAEEILIEIENLNIRPEFEVLKPYFEKMLRSKSVDVLITLVLDLEKNVIALSAASEDLAKINRETIEGVRFRFVENLFRGKGKLPVQEELQQRISSGDGQAPLYESGEELLADILEKGNYRHRRQLQYLSTLHEGSILKIRFVLYPFSFVFLLTGKNQYHIVMETLDTEEATYIWHFPKSIPALKQGVLEIEEQLGKIRIGGRQLFLQAKPENFSRVLHDYTDERKGFVVWKDSLEECLW
jgi:superfamily II DNA or RNA helicase